MCKVQARCAFAREGLVIYGGFFLGYTAHHKKVRERDAYAARLVELKRK